MGLDTVLLFLVIWLLCAGGFIVSRQPSPQPPYAMLVIAGLLVAIAIVFAPMIRFH